MDGQKTVSIIMGTYNGEKFIREQLDSILAQTYPIKESSYRTTVRLTAR